MVMLIFLCLKDEKMPIFEIIIKDLQAIISKTDRVRSLQKLVVIVNITNIDPLLVICCRDMILFIVMQNYFLLSTMVNYLHLPRINDSYKL